MSGLGDWGGGVFNGGAWLRIDGRSVDVHCRDLDVVDRETERSREGDFDIEPLMFHLAGIPSYLVVGELSVNMVLHGELAPVAYPRGPAGRGAPHMGGTGGHLESDGASPWLTLRNVPAGTLRQTRGGVGYAAVLLRPVMAP